MRGGLPPFSSRAMALWDVEQSRASSTWERPRASRRSVTWAAIEAKSQPSSAWARRRRSRSNGSAGVRFARVPLLIRRQISYLLYTTFEIECKGRRRHSSTASRWDTLAPRDPAAREVDSSRVTAVSRSRGPPPHLQDDDRDHSIVGQVEVEAVRRISFAIEEGELFGLLGP